MNDLDLCTKDHFKNVNIFNRYAGSIKNTPMHLQDVVMMVVATKKNSVSLHPEDVINQYVLLYF